MRLNPSLGTEIFIMAFIVLTTACAAGNGRSGLSIGTGIGVLTFDGFDQLASQEALGTFKNTKYFLKEESDYGSLPKNDELKDMNGEIIAQVSDEYKKALNIEGSGKLADGRVVNFSGVKSGEIRYQITLHEWGIGVGNCALVPFRSVAVDPKRIPLGSMLKIEETINMPLPDGTKHDGYWVAADTGASIKDNRIDLFTGKELWSQTIEGFGIQDMQALHVTLVALPRKGSCLEQQAQ